MELLYIIAIVALVCYLLKSYLEKHDTIIAYTGGLGSGKSFLSVKKSLKLLRLNRRKVKRHNFIEKLKSKLKKGYSVKLWEKPMLYASIPVRISRKEWAIQLKQEHLLLTKGVILRSVVFIDEVGSWASQFDWDNENIRDNFDEFIRLYRHYTQGGYMVVNDQCSENIVLQIRRRINKVFNLMNFKKWFGIIYTVNERNICISEEIKTIEDENIEDGMSLQWGFMPAIKHYDTYCYSGRYRTVPHWRERVYNKYKKCELLHMPSKRIKKKTTDVEELVTIGEMLSEKETPQTPFSL